MGLRPILVAAMVLFALIATPRAATAEEPTIKIGVLKFGTVSWVIDVIHHNGLDRAAGIKVDTIELANGQATQVALQARSVDAIVNDWLWVSRQRAEGADWTFFPFSSALGAVMVPGNSLVQSIKDLKGLRLGVAGTPIDKSWLMLQMLAKDRYGIDLDTETTHPFAAPPLIDEQLRAGRVDAVLTYWNFAAKLEARGMRRLASMNDVLAELGFGRDLPLVGFVVSDKWIAENGPLLAKFVDVLHKAMAILVSDNAEWQRLQPMTGAADQIELEKLRDAFRAGVTQRWGDADRASAAKLYGLLAKAGGDSLVGPHPELAPGTFTSAVRF